MSKDVSEKGNIQRYWYDKGVEDGLKIVDTEKFYYRGFEDAINAAKKIITDHCGIMDIHAFNAIQELESLLKR